MSVIDRGDSRLTWDCCAGHVVIATRHGLDWISRHGRGSIHTTGIDSPPRVKTRDDPPYRPYLAISDQQLHRDMIAAQQSVTPRVTMSDFIIQSIRERVERILRDVQSDERKDR